MAELETPTPDIFDETDDELLAVWIADNVLSKNENARRIINAVRSITGLKSKLAALTARLEAAERERAELGGVLRELREQCDHEYRLAKRRAAGFLKTREREHVNGFIAACEAVDAHRPCTCHPDDNPPSPCPRKYALSECRAAALKERK